MGDNGGDKEKVNPGAMSPEDKKKAFEANPDDFIHIGDLIVATARMPNGTAILINPASDKEYHYSRSKLDFIIQQQLAFMEIQQAKKAQENKKIITGAQSHMSFRKFLGRKN